MMFFFKRIWVDIQETPNSNNAKELQLQPFSKKDDQTDSGLTTLQVFQWILPGWFMKQLWQFFWMVWNLFEMVPGVGGRWSKLTNICIYIYVYDVFFSKMDGSIDIWWCMDRFSPATCPREKALSNPCFSLQKDGGLVQVKRIVLVQGAEWEIWGLVEMVEIWWCMRNLYRWNNLGGDIDIFLSDTIQEEESAKKAFEEYVVSMNWSQSLLLCMMGNWRLMLEMMAKLVTFSLFDRSDWCDLEMPESVAQFHFAPETSPKRFSTFPTISHSWRVVTCCNRL